MVIMDLPREAIIVLRVNSVELYHLQLHVAKMDNGVEVNSYIHAPVALFPMEEGQVLDL
jgi:hypothetical protein